MKKLNGCQRIAIVFSLTWIFIVGGYTWIKITDEAIDTAISRELSCRANAQMYGERNPELFLEDCRRKFKDTRKLFLEGRLESVVAVTLIPVALFWLAFWGLRGVLRWIRKGFDSQN